MKKLSYNDAPETDPFNQFSPTFNQDELDINLDNKSENLGKDGKEFPEFEEFKKEKTKKQLKKDKKNVVIQPQPFYENLYGTPGDLSGATTPGQMEYLGDNISDENSITNPYNEIYQSSTNVSANKEIQDLIIFSHYYASIIILP
jgi:hypothetical protein